MESITLVEAIENSFVVLWQNSIELVPHIIAALLVIVVGLIVAPIFGNIVRKIVRTIQIDTLSDKTGVTEMFAKTGLVFKFSDLIGKIVKWFFILVFFIAAADILGWNRITEFLNEIVLYVPNILVAVVILALGLIAGQFIKRLVEKSLLQPKVPIKHPEVLANIAKWAMVTFASLAALIQLGIAERLIEILFGGLVLALALAFGLGGKEKAMKLLDYLDGSVK